MSGYAGDTGELYERKDGLWDWRRRAVNGQIVATSGGQGYENEEFARHMAETRNPGIYFKVVELQEEVIAVAPGEPTSATDGEQSG